MGEESWKVMTPFSTDFDASPAIIGVGGLTTPDHSAPSAIFLRSTRFSMFRVKLSIDFAAPTPATCREAAAKGPPQNNKLVSALAAAYPSALTPSVIRGAPNNRQSIKRQASETQRLSHVKETLDRWFQFASRAASRKSAARLCHPPVCRSDAQPWRDGAPPSRLRRRAPRQASADAPLPRSDRSALAPAAAAHAPRARRRSPGQSLGRACQHPRRARRRCRRGRAPRAKMAVGSLPILPCQSRLAGGDLERRLGLAF